VRVKVFKYLGTILAEDNDIITEIKQRIIMANKISYGLKKKLYSPNMNRQTKCMYVIQNPYKTGYKFERGHPVVYIKLYNILCTVNIQHTSNKMQ